MDKPTVLAIDYLEKRYTDTEDIIKVICRTSIIDDLDGISGVIIHNPCGVDDYIPLIEESIRRKLPLIIHAKIGGAMRDRIEEVYDGYPNAHYVHSNYELSKTLRDIFDKDKQNSE